MKRQRRADGLYLYTPETEDLERQALLALARRQVEQLPDEEAAQFSALLPLWQAGRSYTPGQRLRDKNGALYRVAKKHTAKAAKPIENTGTLYQPLQADE